MPFLYESLPGGLVTGASLQWMRARHLRAHGLILALCLWSVYVWNMSTPGLRDRVGNLKGTDFVHFYTLGLLALAHDGADLYNLSAQSKIAAARVPAAAGIHYLPLYPPQLSIFFAPLAKLSYAPALVAWLTLSSLIYFCCCYAFWRACPNLRDQKITTLILAVAFPAFWHLIAWGQTSALALACFTAAFFALRARREFFAGLAFGCLIFKPQLAVGAAIVFVFALRWRIIVGALSSSLLELIGATLYYGLGPLHNWIQSMLMVRHRLTLLEPRPYQTHCLRTFWSMLIPWPPISFTFYLLSGLFVSVLLISCWRGRLPLAVRFSALLFTSVLLSPHLTVYDLVILAPAFLLLSDSIIARHGETAAYLPVLLYLAFILPLLGPLARWTHLQLTVPVMVAIVYVIWNSGRQTAGFATSPQKLVPEQKL
ncbi:MAG: glycosyltransferase family 87 protein [Candidatus Sulfotelmatobacter sp.]